MVEVGFENNRATIVTHQTSAKTNNIFLSWIAFKTGTEKPSLFNIVQET
jgi:hypothetical protein